MELAEVGEKIGGAKVAKVRNYLLLNSEPVHGSVWSAGNELQLSSLRGHKTADRRY